ncbi:hypothetical protein BDF20DRAFT_882406 [Mycotypha africana]|uniref:uncharacterized protein n=1 Tax=Mycotypha africana TaxID=64632 RepID=UPI002300D913|nr:uncharacterized protein BDF20DRAFT_882406 [Mycotypha africana]KAI8973446.1 hypothetical protein BDF20DRAFT_882406 [Mycotypha africana]
MGCYKYKRLLTRMCLCQQGLLNPNSSVKLSLAFLQKRSCILATLNDSIKICGDRLHGVWNVSEQSPRMIVGGAIFLASFPANLRIIDWVPVEYASCL